MLVKILWHTPKMWTIPCLVQKIIRLVFFCILWKFQSSIILIGQKKPFYIFSFIDRQTFFFFANFCVWPSPLRKGVIFSQKGELPSAVIWQNFFKIFLIPREKKFMSKGFEFVNPRRLLLIWKLKVVLILKTSVSSHLFVKRTNFDCFLANVVNVSMWRSLFMKNAENQNWSTPCFIQGD